MSFRMVDLKELSFQASFKEILCNLILCREHRPKDAQLFWSTFCSYLSMNPFLTSQNMLDFTRTRLDRYLVGETGENIRRKLVTNFNQVVRDHKQLRNIPDVWVFLDCVLSETFHELDTHISFPNSEPNPSLFRTIANRCPLLGKLTVNLSNWKNQEAMMDTVKPVVTSLIALQHLTQLSLTGMHERSRCVLRFIGISCPSLSHLSVSGLNLEKKDVLGLVIGELIDDIFPNPLNEPSWCQDAALNRLIVPAKFRTPICHSLQDLKLSNVGGTDGVQTLKWGLADCYYGFSASVTAFLLRHFPLLSNLGDRLPTSLAIKILHDAPIDTEDAVIQTEFEKACCKALLGRQDDSTLIFNPNRNLIPAFSGTLLFTKLDFVTAVNADVLRAIGSMCPHLKDVTFSEAVATGIFSPELIRQPNDSISCEDLESILSAWPKIETIKFLQVSSKYVKYILKVLGPELKNRTFEMCNRVNLKDLAPCSLLENLSILRCCTLNMNKKAMVSTLTPVADWFLPNLTCFKSQICLGHWSRLFEEYCNTLINVTLNCCHIGIEVCTDVKWSSFPHMWPALEHLEIQECYGLSIDNVSNWAAAQFNSKLKTVVLPGDFRRFWQRELLSSFQNSSTRIGFSTSNLQDCCFLKEESEDSSSDEDVFGYDDAWDYDYYDEVCESYYLSLGSDYGGYF